MMIPPAVEPGPSFRSKPLNSRLEVDGGTNLETQQFSSMEQSREDAVDPCSPDRDSEGAQKIADTNSNPQKDEPEEHWSVLELSAPDIAAALKWSEIEESKESESNTEKAYINSIPLEVLQIIIDKLVVDEELWRSLELRRVGHRFNECILRAICFTGALDPLERYGFSGYRNGTYHLTYQHKFPHLFARGPHPHVVPLMHRIATSSRYAMNAYTLIIRKAADWIEQTYQAHLPDKTQNMRWMAEILMLVTELKFWDSFAKSNESLFESEERFSRNEKENALPTRSLEDVRVAQAVDLALGIATYSGQHEVFRYLIHNLPGNIHPLEVILTTLVAASYKGNIDALSGTLSGAFLSTCQFIRADHWASSMENWMLFRRVFMPLKLILKVAAMGSQKNVIKWVVNDIDRFKDTNSSDAIRASFMSARDARVISILWSSLGPSNVCSPYYITKIAFTAAAFGDVDIVEAMWNKGFNPATPATGRWFCEEDGYKGPKLRNEYILNVAIMHGRKNVAELLLNGNVNPYAFAATDGSSIGDAMACAKRKKREDIVQLLIEHGYGEPADVFEARQKGAKYGRKTVRDWTIRAPLDIDGIPEPEPERTTLQKWYNMNSRPKPSRAQTNPEGSETSRRRNTQNKVLSVFKDLWPRPS